MTSTSTTDPRRGIDRTEQYWTEMSEGLPRPVRLADGAGLTSMPQRMMGSDTESNSCKTTFGCRDRVDYLRGGGPRRCIRVLSRSHDGFR